MKHKTKRLLSWLLALAMVFSMLPGMSFSASAEMGDDIRDDDCLTFTAVEGPASFKLDRDDQTSGDLRYQKQNIDGTWANWDDYKELVINLNDGQSVRFRGTNTKFDYYSHVLIEEGKVACSGNVMSLRLDSEGKEQGLTDSCFSYMFKNCTGLTRAPALPATLLETYCYEGMFEDCTNLTTAPELPATMLAEGCYSCMFYGCEKLTKAPELLARDLEVYCYNRMFYSCSQLNAVTCLATDISASYANNATNYWLDNVAKNGTFTKTAEEMENGYDWQNGGSGIPEGWNVTVPVTGVTLDQIEAELTVGGNTVTLTATVAPEAAADRTVTWTSSNETVATVADGVVTAVAAGTATITATSNADSTKSDGCDVTVSAAAAHTHDCSVENGIPMWSWHQIGNNWQASVMYACQCLEAYSDPVEATVTKVENAPTEGKVTFTAAAPEHAEVTSSRTFDMTGSITQADGSSAITGLVQNVAYGTQVKLTTKDKCDWYVNGAKVSENADYIWLSVKGTMSVKAEPTQNETAVGSVIVTAEPVAMTSTKVKLVLNYALPKGAKVSSAILYRGYMNGEVFESEPTQTNIKSKVTKTNGIYTATITLSKQQAYGGRVEIKFTYNGTEYTLSSGENPVSATPHTLD